MTETTAAPQAPTTCDDPNAHPGFPCNHPTPDPSLEVTADVELQPEFEGLVLDLEATPNHGESKRPICNCGCNARTNHPQSVFIQGHDQVLKGKLIRAGRAGQEVTILQGGMAVTGEAAGMAVHLLKPAGVAQVLAGIAKPAKARKTAANPTAVPWTEAPAVKVGRWTYPARTNGLVIERNTKRDGSGEWVAV